MEVRDSQPEKQLFPSLVTEEGMSMEVRDEQSLKHSSPRLVTEEGMSIEVRDLQPLYLQLTVYQFVLFKMVEKLFRGFY